MDNLIIEIIEIRQLFEASLNPSFYESYEPIFQFFFILISVFLGAIVTYFFTRKQSDKEFKKTCYISFLNAFNEYLSDINEIIMNILKINKLGPIVCDDEFRKFIITDLSNYYNVITVIKEFRFYLNNKLKKHWLENTLYEEYYKKLQIAANEMVDFDLFIRITKKMQKNSINYYYIIDHKLRNKYDEILKEVQEYTMKNMYDFNIENFNKELVDYIKVINNTMLKI
ncbi:MAG: hypothetical protein FWD40_06940 [Treponema sp.]|nr:hypothetical protein [Treponema sp.]